MPLRTVLPAALCTALVVSAGSPASAAQTGATVTVTVGALSLTVPADAGNLGTLANTLDGGTVSSSLGEVTVDDARSAGPEAGWVVSVVSTPFALPDAPDAPPIPATGAAYTAGAIVTVGTVEVEANDPVDLSTLTPAVTATGITGDNSATWSPTITVTIPGSSLTGVYAATITHSVI